MAVCTIKSQASNNCLNIKGNTQVSENRDVNIHSYTGSLDQQWQIPSLQANYSLIKSNINPSYALNAYRSGDNWNCDIHTWSGNEQDAEVQFILVSGSIYKIKLRNRPNRYLTATGSGSTSNVTWSAEQNTALQQWNIQPVTPPSGSKTLPLIVGRNCNWNQFCPAVTNAISGSKAGCLYCCAVDIANLYGSKAYLPSDMPAPAYWGSNGWTGAMPANCGAIQGEVTFSFQTIKADIDANRFIIVKMSGGPNSTNHYVVAYGYVNGCTKAADVKVLDPSNLDSSFNKVYTSQSGLMITLAKSMNNNSHPNLTGLRRTTRP